MHWLLTALKVKESFMRVFPDGQAPRRIVERWINRCRARRGALWSNAMKSTVMMAGLIALACSSLPAFAKVQGTGLAIADVTLAHVKAEHRDRAIDAARNLASHRADRSSTQSHQG
ncbi:hypothetical protein [Burkholderia sp. BCC0044]|uniref:hypothetical protein n=1 Tax=Burkholderia sp. BCC0044 TaxID=2676295 RepID=UPI001FC808B2|nr:hypothetical protein [Burkholderia sp. BCC0044]